MLIVINIPEELAEKGHWYTDKEMWTVIRAAHNGTPLEQIQADIYEEFMTIDGGVHDKSAIKCMEIIDKYIKEQTNDERNK